MMQGKMRMAAMATAAMYALALAACSQEATSASATAAGEVAPATQQSAPASETGLDPTILAASRVSPEAFLRALVDLYKDGNVPTDQMPDNQAFFSTSTSALIEGIVAKDDMAFGADPFCDCQDWMSLKVASVQQVSADATNATIDLTMAGDTALTQRYMLVKEAGGWRVDDIVHPEYGSMIALLKAR